MSPEQVRAKPLDARTDLYSFGVVLYEMATGRLPSSGESTGVIFEAILNRSPRPASSVVSGIPAELDRIIQKALEKDRELRYQHASDMRSDLKRLKRDSDSGRMLAVDPSNSTHGVGANVVASGSQVVHLSSGEVRQAASFYRWMMIGGVCLAAIVGAGGYYYRFGMHSERTAGPMKERQLTTNSSENAVLSGKISPDGKYLLYSDGKGVHLKLIETGELSNIALPEGQGGRPVQWVVAGWFPDGTHFLMNAMVGGMPAGIWKLSLIGGSRRKLREGQAWSISPDGTQISCRTGGVRVSKSAVLLRESGWEMVADFYDSGSFKPHVGATANAGQRRTFRAGTDGAEWTGQYRAMLDSPGKFMRARGGNPGSQAADFYGV